MATPTVTITVGGVPVSSMDKTVAALDDTTEIAKGLHMIYVQATNGDKREQWVLIPPSLGYFGLDHQPHLYRILHRDQDFPGNRFKWFHELKNICQFNKVLVLRTENSNWTLSDVFLVPLEQDDYKSAHAGVTPHKALRAVSRALEPHGISVK